MKHGMSNHPAYAVWQVMKDRCYNPKNKQYKNYGARGVLVCEHWANSFERFWEDMGPTWQKGLELDRYPNNNGNYAPGNCRWATREQQNRNTRANKYLDTPGGRMCITEAAEVYSINVRTLHSRIKRGLAGDELFAPVREGKYGHWTRNKHGRPSNANIKG